MKKRFTDEQIIGFLREAEAGLAVAELCRRHGFSEASYYLWRSKFGGMKVSDAKRLKELETENARLERLLAEAMLENEVTKEALRKKVVIASARCELVRHMISSGLSERRSLRIIGMSASALRYEPAADRNCALKEKIIALAQRHSRYGSGIIYLKLRQEGEILNHKRVDRLYAEAGLQVKKRRRKKVSLCDRHPLERPIGANQVWSMDFVFDRTAEGRSIIESPHVLSLSRNMGEYTGEQNCFVVNLGHFLLGFKVVFQWTPAPPNASLKAANNIPLAAFF